MATTVPNRRTQLPRITPTIDDSLTFQVPRTGDLKGTKLKDMMRVMGGVVTEKFTVTMLVGVGDDTPLVSKYTGDKLILAVGAAVIDRANAASVLSVGYTGANNQWLVNLDLDTTTAGATATSHGLGNTHDSWVLDIAPASFAPTVSSWNNPAGVFTGKVQVYVTFIPLA